MPRPCRVSTTPDGAVWSRRGTPQPIILKLNAAINKGLQMPAAIQIFVSSELDPATFTPAGLQELIGSELQLWRKLIKDADISVNTL